MDQELYKIAAVPWCLTPSVRRILYTDCTDEISVNLSAPPTGYNYIQWIARGHGEAIGSIVPAINDGPSVGIAGQIASIDARIDLSGRLRHILAELSAHGLYSLLGIYGQDVVDRVVMFQPGDAQFTESVQFLIEYGRTDPPIEELLNAFYSFLEDLCANCLEMPAYIQTGAERAENAGGNIKLSEMAGEISERHFSRQFQKYVGIRPIYFANIIRVNCVLYRLIEAEHGDLATIAQDAGFYDQSHMIRTLKSHCRTTPKDFAKSVDAILSRFHMESQR